MINLPPISHKKAFSLIELLVVIVIIAIIGGIALPSYSKYMKKARYSEVIQAAAPYKLSVTSCFQQHHSLNNCNSGSNDIPTSISHGIIASIRVHSGVISITPKAEYGFTANDTYVLTPTINNSHLKWSKSGEAINKGYA